MLVLHKAIHNSKNLQIYPINYRHPSKRMKSHAF